MSKDHLERSPRLYLSEIVFYIEKVEAFTDDLTREQFLADEVKVYAVDDLVRNIGEAVRVSQNIDKSKTYSIFIESLMLDCQI